MSFDFSTYADHLLKLGQTQLYREVLVKQMELIWPLTKTYLQNCAQWVLAKTVNDLGCGPGDLLFKLISQFPEKTFWGCDLNVDFLETAKSSAKAQGLPVSFEHKNLLASLWPRADFTILNSVLQHIPDLSGFIQNMQSSLSSNDVILFNDAADDQAFCMTQPPIEVWEDLMKHLAQKQKDAGGNRNALSNLLTILPPSFRVLDDRTVTMSITDEQRQNFACYVLSVGHLLPGFFGMHVDLANLKNQAAEWCINPKSSALFKSRRLLLQKI